MHLANSRTIIVGECMCYFTVYVNVKSASVSIWGHSKSWTRLILWNSV